MEMDSVKRYRLILWALFGIACAVYLIVVDISGIDTEVMRDRFKNADALFNGEAPVTDSPPPPGCSHRLRSHITSLTSLKFSFSS